ncbi:maleylpyruvate isomerase family mycothiol-dependent enzyme [Acidothermaceae bacterium B102]|nr:maleylpyruvate isomerase family mycothiol-dependent enzyme [Acidothermaceae bacterium B102]
MELADAIEAMRVGEELLARAVGQADPLTAPSLLPGWSRAHVVAHLAGNAEALLNLLHWAETGVETPMYADNDVRNADIERWRLADRVVLLAHAADAADRLDEAVERMPSAGWQAQVRTNSGRLIPAAEVPWMRCREVYIHAVDLDAGIGFDALSAPLTVALLDEIVGSLSAKSDCPSASLHAAGHAWQLGTGPTSGVIEGSGADLLAWLLGRSSGNTLVSADPIPTVPRWL